MKLAMIKFPVLIMFALLAVTSCKKKDDATPSGNMNTTVQQGKWRVSLFQDSGNDETNHFTGYQFQFNSNGTISVTNGSQTATGTWSAGNDDSQLKLVLGFGATSPFDELNDDWHVIEQNTSTIKLEDVSGGNGGTDYLNFVKI